MTTVTLLGSTGSPYARKVRALLLERSIPFDWVEAAVPTLQNMGGGTQWTWKVEDPAKLTALNPVGKLPVLLHDGQAGFDSRVICEYVDRVIVQRPAPQRASSSVHALADVLCDHVSTHNALKRRLLANEAACAADAALTTSYVSDLLAALEGVDVDSDASTQLSTPLIALHVALAYLDFRLPALDWRSFAPKLAVLFASNANRPSLAATHFPGESI